MTPVNPSRAKGTAAESAIVRWARANGFPWADRQPLRGGRDQGDITLCPGVIVEAKDHARTGVQITPGTLRTWMAQTETERANARADHAVLVVKRGGTTDPGRWSAYVTAWALAELIYPARASEAVDSPALTAPVRLDLADLAVLLRCAGWGSPLDGDEVDG